MNDMKEDGEHQWRESKEQQLIKLKKNFKTGKEKLGRSIKEFECRYCWREGKRRKRELWEERKREIKKLWNLNNECII